jgi:hypothetical protein
MDPGPALCAQKTLKPACGSLGKKRLPWYIRKRIHMPTTVHIPAPLLKSVDRRAKALGVSRNRLIVKALERAISERAGWAPEFLDQLRKADDETIDAVDELLNVVKQGRRSKPPREL